MLKAGLMRIGLLVRAGSTAPTTSGERRMSLRLDRQVTCITCPPTGCRWGRCLLSKKPNGQRAADVQGNGYHASLSSGKEGGRGCTDRGRSATQSHDHHAGQG